MHTRNSIALLLVHIGSCVLLLSAGVSGVGNPVQNIDVLQPIVRRSPARGDASNDLFGWAAIFHQVEQVDSSDTMSEAARKTRLIVGAPHGTYPGGLSSITDPGAERVVQTGLVYTCPILPGSCEGIRGDTTVYLNNPAARDNDASLSGSQLIDYPQSYIEGRLFDQAPNAKLWSTNERTYLPAENKTGQLLGATLYSNGERFIACAPRWTDTNIVPFQLQPRGVCYAGLRDLTGFERLQPCDSPSGRSDRTTFDGYCMAGTSVLIHNSRYVLGAPGIEEFRGALYYTANLQSDTFMRGTTTAVNLTTMMGDPSITDQYQGFATVSAFITSQRMSNQPPPNVVTSVPRSDANSYTGRVNVYTSDNYTDIVLSVDAQGTQMGEFFGHSMIAIDINGDDYDDLVVGAPMNTDFNALKIERGRVYVFMNNGAGALNNPIIFNGPIPRGRFGNSITNLGDINLDGFEDFAVGAPYADNGNNTGVVYIYYGSNNVTAFEQQAPFEITASDIVNNVTGLDRLNTFGFSVSGGIDVDNNQYKDLVVGAYKDQTVVLLRTLPIVTVTVGISAPAEVDLNSNFSVDVTAFYEGAGVNGRIDVPFVLSEIRSASNPPRLKFANDGRGMFTISGSGSGNTNTQRVTVTSLENTTSLVNHMLQLTIEDIVRDVTPGDGNQPLVDLSSFPRLLQTGPNTASVAIRNPCGNNGCQFDVRLRQPSRDIIVTAGGETVHTVEFDYESMGPEDAVGLYLNFTNLATFIRSVAIQRGGLSPSLTPCEAVSNGRASCVLRARINPGGMERVMVSFTVDQELVVGNEEDFSVALEIVSLTDDMNDMDMDTSNNAQQVGFSVNAMADISVLSLSFGGTRFEYTAMPPTSETTTGLGRSVTLQVDIFNSGPTIIREGQLTIFLANRIDNGFTLYPTRIRNESNNPNERIVCQTGFINPDGLPTGSPQISEGRRRRSAAQSRLSSHKRVTRQENNANPKMNSCIGPTVDSAICTTIMCDIFELKPGTVTLSIFTRIDERYFTRPGVAGNVFNLTSSANVSVIGSFYGDTTNNNTGKVSITLVPMEVEQPGESDRNLLHFILWPCIGGILLLILAAVLLYFVGFFRRKRKPEDGEIEGDFDLPPDQFKMKPEDGKEPSAPMGAESADAPPSSEITKV